MRRQKIADRVAYIDWCREDARTKARCGLLTTEGDPGSLFEKKRQQLVKLLAAIDTFVSEGLSDYECLGDGLVKEEGAK
jgi:hypothetical protein